LIKKLLQYALIVLSRHNFRAVAAFDRKIAVRIKLLQLTENV